MFHIGNFRDFLVFQLWDIRDGTCKQTFPGHESDINAVTVSIFDGLRMSRFQLSYLFTNRALFLNIIVLS